MHVGHAHVVIPVLVELLPDLYWPSFSILADFFNIGQVCLPYCVGKFDNLDAILM